MENNNNNNYNGGITFCGLLCIVFITLKLLNVISWSWLWVLSPIWIPVSIVLTIFVIVFLIVLIYDLTKRIY